MAEAPLGTGLHYFADPSKGKPVYFGDVYVGVPALNPKVEANRVAVTLLQESGARVTISPNMQPLKTGAGGIIIYNESPAVILVSDTVSVRVDNKSGAQVMYNPRFNESTTGGGGDIIQGSSGLIPANGSFENESQAGVPANWTLTPTINGVIATDTTTSSHGLASLKITGQDVSGGGFATSDRFNVLEGGKVDIRFSYKTSSVSTLNKVEIQFYSAAGAIVTTSTVLTNGATNPLVFQSFLLNESVPATSVQAAIILTGVDAAGTTTTGSTNYDDISVTGLVETSEVGESGTIITTAQQAAAVNTVGIVSTTAGTPPAIAQAGPDDVGLNVENVLIKNSVITGALTGNVTGNVNGDLIGETNSIILNTEEVASPVHNLVITNAIAGSGPIIASEGADTHIDININPKNSGFVKIKGIELFAPTMLVTPAVLIDGLTQDAWTALQHPLLDSVNAKAAILRFYASGNSSTESATIQGYLRQNGEVTANNNLTRAFYSHAGQFGGATAVTGAMTEVTVGVSNGGQFDYYMETNGMTGLTSYIALIGYYT